MKEVSFKRLYIGWFYLDDIVKKIKYSNKNRLVVVRGLGGMFGFNGIV